MHSSKDTTKASSKGHAPPKVPVVPRHSASLVLVNARNQVLLVHRNPESRTFAGIHAFPGGNYDVDQDPSLQVTAIRETFEETGVLLAKPIASGNKSTELPDSLLDEARKVIHAQKLSFGAFLAEHALEADTSALWPFSQWITPPTAPKRFHTRFYVSFLPKSSSFQPEDDSDSSRARKHHLPTSDGGIEVVAATFLHPKVALSKFHQGEISLMPPQYYILSLLSGIFEKSLDVNTQEQRDTVLDLARGTFGRMVINPRGLVSTSSDKDRDKGKGALEKDGLGLGTVLTYEGDETRGGSKGRLHRVIMWTGKGGAPRDMTLLRNFNIFNEIEEHLFPPPPHALSPPHAGAPGSPFPPDIPIPAPQSTRSGLASTGLAKL